MKLSLQCRLGGIYLFSAGFVVAAKLLIILFLGCIFISAVDKVYSD